MGDFRDAVLRVAYLADRFELREGDWGLLLVFFWGPALWALVFGVRFATSGRGVGRALLEAGVGGLIVGGACLLVPTGWMVPPGGFMNSWQSAAVHPPTIFLANLAFLGTATWMAARYTGEARLGALGFGLMIATLVFFGLAAYPARG